MWENILVIIIIGLCLIAVGRRFYRLFKNAGKTDGAVDCSGDCSSCCSSGKGSKK
jgi:hypothetical protein